MKVLKSGLWLLAALFSVSPLAGCSSSDVQVGWEFEFADDALRGRAVMVEGTIFEGGCTSTLSRYVGVATPMTMPAAPPPMPPGRYGFAGRARDAGCTWFAEACVEVDVPATDGSTIVVVLEAAREMAACPSAQCMDGVCEGDTVDAGSDSAVPDAAMDSAIDSAIVDSAIVDASPDAPCTVDGAACAGGTCRGGSCCTGCWDGVSCVDGAALAACGAGGAACAACDCECSDRACTGPAVRSLAVGAYYSCAVDSIGALYCWGANDAGQLGLGTTSNVTANRSPQRVGTATDWAGPAGGDEHTCSVPADGSLRCWGDNEDGQIGTGDLTSRSSPATVGTDVDWDVVDAARVGDHTCMLKDDGTLYCMGQNNYGQLGIGTLVDALLPTLVPGTYRAISVGHYHTCGIRMDGSLWCWGRGVQGQHGLGDLAVHSSPEQVGADTDWDAIGLGDAHSCGIRGGRLYCWGYNATGQLGDTTLSRRTTPTAIGGDTDWLIASGGDEHTCAAKTTGRVFCTGSDEEGQLGDGVIGGVALTFTEVPGLRGVDAVSAGQLHTCVRVGDGSMWCWGGNEDGALGRGHRVSSATPRAVCIGL